MQTKLEGKTYLTEFHCELLWLITLYNDLLLRNSDDVQKEGVIDIIITSMKSDLNINSLAYMFKQPPKDNINTLSNILENSTSAQQITIIRIITDYIFSLSLERYSDTYISTIIQSKKIIDNRDNRLPPENIKILRNLEIESSEEFEYTLISIRDYSQWVQRLVKLEPKIWITKYEKFANNSSNIDRQSDFLKLLFFDKALDASAEFNKEEFYKLFAELATSDYTAHTLDES